MDNSSYVDKTTYLICFLQEHLIPKAVISTTDGQNVENDILLLRNVQRYGKDSVFYRSKMDEYAKLAVHAPKWTSAFYVMLFECFSIAWHQSKIEQYKTLQFCKQMSLSHAQSIEIIFQRAKEYLILLGMYKELTLFENKPQVTE